MSRHQVNVSSMLRTGDGRRWGDAYRCEWAAVVGDRIRRERRARRLSLIQLASRVHKPYEGRYSAGYFSRLERGWASAPLYVYLAIAEALDLDAGRLLGSDDVQAEVTGGEMTLVRFLRDAGIPSHEALRAVVDAQAAARLGPRGA